MLVHIQDLKTGRLLGTGTERDGLYYLDNGAGALALAAYSSSKDELLLYHRRLGHLSFEVMSRLFPSLLSSCSRGQLVCDVCELAKHTRSTYSSSGKKVCLLLRLFILMFGALVIPHQFLDTAGL